MKANLLAREAFANLRKSEAGSMPATEVLATKFHTCHYPALLIETFANKRRLRNSTSLSR